MVLIVHILNTNHTGRSNCPILFTSDASSPIAPFPGLAVPFLLLTSPLHASRLGRSSPFSTINRWNNGYDVILKDKTIAFRFPNISSSQCSESDFVARILERNFQGHRKMCEALAIRCEQGLRVSCEYLKSA